MIVLSALVSAPVLAQQAAPASPPGVVPTTGNPNLSVAAVKLDGGVRASKVIGTPVYAGADKVGSVDDLVMTNGNTVTVAVVAIGGVLGLGSKLIAVPFSQLKRDGDRMVLDGATKASIDAMPSLTY